MSDTARHTWERIVWVHRWQPGLVSFRLSRPAGWAFKAGQFARLGRQRAVAVDDKHPDGTAMVWRAFSMASASDDDFLEFYAIAVPGGAFTHDLDALAPGDAVALESVPYGFLTIDRFTDGRDLWMFATGTGLSPYLSMLADARTWQRFEHLVVVHSVRTQGELAYRDQLAQWQADPPAGARAGTLRVLPVVTREACAGALQARIPQALADGSLAAAAGLDLAPAHSRLMLCGNPAMVEDVRALLKPQGYALPRRGQPGSLVVENYW